MNKSQRDKENYLMQKFMVNYKKRKYFQLERIVQHIYKNLIYHNKIILKLNYNNN